MPTKKYPREAAAQSSLGDPKVAGRSKLHSLSCLPPRPPIVVAAANPREFFRLSSLPVRGVADATSARYKQAVRLLAGALVLCGLIQTLTAGEIVGILGSYTSDEGRSYLGVSVENTLVLKTPDGAVLRSNAPQLAGLDERKHAAAMKLMGQRVRIAGSPMERHTVHHATPVLWVAEQITPAKTRKDSPASRKQVEEIPRGSALRAQLFDLARPAAVKAAGQQVKFAGSMKRLGDWVYFSGELVDDRGRPVSVRNLSPEALALWKRVNGEWKVLDVGAGVTDAYHYYVWPREFGTPMELLRAN